MLTQEEQKLEIRLLLTRTRYPSMQAAKEALVALTGLGVLRTPTVNDLLNHLGAESLTYGDEWGWPDLYYDLLSNKYGAAALYDQKKEKTYFVLRLPPVEHIMTEEETKDG